MSFRTWRKSAVLAGAAAGISACSVFGTIDFAGNTGSGGGSSTGASTTSSTTSTTSSTGSTTSSTSTGGATTSSTVVCMKASDCANTNPCKIPSCDGATGTCNDTNVTDGTPTPGVTPVMGDCKVHVCVGGVDTAEDDDSNVPAIPTAMAGCADAKCTNGVPSNPLHAVDSGCSHYMGSMPGYCDAAGNCVQCTMDNECPGKSDDCEHPACVGASCTVAFTAAGTATTGHPPQVPGDCHELVCLGSVVNMVDYQAVVDDTDAPVTGTPCLTDTCTGGTVMQTVNVGASCGGSGVCDSSAECGCQSNADCTLPSTCGGGGTPLVCGCTPTTCAALGKTCGGPFSDGCFRSLSCDDGIEDGNETDVDCGGSVTSCATRCAQGRKCKVGTDCTSGFCTDGVCCNVACAGSTCEACSAAAKGQGMDGVCGAVILGKDPHGNCSTMAVSTCGESGGCNGASACSTYAPGTTCQAATCMSATVITLAETCNSSMTCKAPTQPTQDCTPFFCNGGACTTTCTTDSQCAVTAFCNTSTHLCVLKLGPGAACSADDQCISNSCNTGTNKCN